MFTDLQKLLPLRNAKELVSFYIAAIEFRNSHKEQSTDIARFVFDTSHESKLNFKLSERLSGIRFEFGALEAPGVPEDDSLSILDYEDLLWDRLKKIIIE